MSGRDPTYLTVNLPTINEGSFEMERYPHNPKSKPKGGLELLSLGECRNINCTGIMKLDKLENLKTLYLLGCVCVKDEGVLYLCKNSDTLETINLSGTCITSSCIYTLANESGISLQNINIIGCKKLKSSDHELLTRRGFNVKHGEDIFRFNLLPEPFSGFKKISQNVLKTRSTLSIYRIYKYLARRIISNIKLLQPSFPEIAIDHDLFIEKLNIEIHCEGTVLPHYMQLKDISEKYWDKPDQLLTLYYRP